MKYHVIGLCGSLRKESFTLKLLKAFKKSAPDGVQFDIIDLSGLPLINEDLESELPETVTELHRVIKGAHAVLFATPEYNRSYSPVIKNAIDWGSRPEGKNNWDGKPAGVIGCSPYQLGAFGAVNHLRQVLMYVNMPVLQQPEFYLGSIGRKLTSNGNINDDDTQKHINDYWVAFVQWIKGNTNSFNY
ncbi:NADPH-dependent FMN reductase [Mucilaginibacter sp. 3215]|uniref:NADPH-dependent FMN reductase n=1 Tax=Mucilaginibacter sp. 3215 TaxID=3373912 RepID=UPI003D24E5B6